MGTIEEAQCIAGHRWSRTTKLYDRNPDTVTINGDREDRDVTQKRTWRDPAFETTWPCVVEWLGAEPHRTATLKKLYEFQFDGDLQPPVAPHVDRRETFYMLRVSRGLAPSALREDEHARIWAWSDLHLGHTETLRAFGRPFASADEMDDKI